jgi:uncharacterized protein with beta-barrel porin domain
LVRIGTEGGGTALARLVLVGKICWPVLCARVLGVLAIAGGLAFAFPAFAQVGGAGSFFVSTFPLGSEAGGAGGTTVDGVGLPGGSGQYNPFSQWNTPGGGGGVGASGGNGTLLSAGGLGGMNGLLSTGFIANATDTFGGAGGGAGQATVGSGGGGGGGGNAVVAAGISNTGALTGGTGGAGSSDGGGGGAGGNGLVLTGAFASINSGSISGGNGGAGGGGIAVVIGGYVSGGFGGGGGNGVVVASTGAGQTINNYGSISGGQGGSDQASIGGTAGGVGVLVSAPGGVTINNYAGGTIQGGASSVPCGIFCGAGAGIVGGNLTIFNNGTISSLGLLAIHFTGGSNSLTLGASSTISGSLWVDGPATTLSFNQSNDTTLSNIIAGNGSVIVNGSTPSTKLVLNGLNNYGGTTTINSGTLEVDGSIASSSLTGVNSGGTLTGTGIVGSTQINSGGIFAPGTAAGTSITVNGNLAFQSGAMYLVQLSPASASLANVSGTATLAGNVLVAFAPGSYAVKQYEILHAAGLTGSFSSASSAGPASGFVPLLSYSGSDVYLNLTSALGSKAAAGNRQAVAKVIDNSFNTGSPLPPTLLPLYDLSGGNLNAALGQLAGETATGVQQTTLAAMTQFMGVMTDPMIDRRGEAVTSPIGAAQFADEGDAASAYADNGKTPTRSERVAYAAMYRKAPPPAPSLGLPWSVWTTGFGGSQTTDGNAALGSNPATSRIYGTAVGADYRISPFTLAGFALAGGGTNFSVANSGFGRSDLFQAGAYLRHRNGAAYLTGALAYGRQDVTTNRTVTLAGGDQLRGQFDTDTFSGRVEGGYRFVTPWMGTTPYVAGQFVHYVLPAYAEQALSENNAFALNFAARDVAASRSEIGLRADRSYALTDAILTLRGRAAWAHDFNNDPSLSATFQSLPGASFVVCGATAHDVGLTTASAEWTWRTGISLAATFEGEFSDVTRSYAGKGVARYSW